MNKFRKITLLTLIAVFIIACESSEKESDTVINARQVIAEISEEFVPDKRVALFEVEAEDREGVILLRGESNIPEAVDNLKKILKEQNVSFSDSITVLPASEVRETPHGIIKISVANLRGEAAHSSELVTQSTLGMPVKVYKKKENWYLIQTPDDYLAWVDSGGVELLSDNEFSAWKSAEKLIFKETFGFSYEEPNAEADRVSDLVVGSILEVTGEQEGFYKVKYPDSKIAFVPKEHAQPYDEWLASVEISGENLVETSRSLMGLPYLWGGTSSKGVDCSGFTKTVFFMNGLIIPRDASQQINTGEVVDSTRNFENLIPGDLLFFGRPASDSTAERVIHVGMWVGGHKFIHSMGNVHISNMDTKAEDFDEYNYIRYLRTKRVAGEEHDRLIYLKKRDIFNDTTSVKELSKG